MKTAGGLDPSVQVSTSSSKSFKRALHGASSNSDGACAAVGVVTTAKLDARGDVHVRARAYLERPGLARFLLSRLPSPFG